MCVHSRTSGDSKPTHEDFLWMYASVQMLCGPLGASSFLRMHLLPFMLLEISILTCIGFMLLSSKLPQTYWLRNNPFAPTPVLAHRFQSHKSLWTWLSSTLRQNQGMDCAGFVSGISGVGSCSHDPSVSWQIQFIAITWGPLSYQLLRLIVQPPPL